MSNSPEAISNWATHFLNRYQGVRASVHAMQLELEQKTAANPTSTSIKRLARESEALNAAFTALNISKPAKETFNPMVRAPRTRWKKEQADE